MVNFCADIKNISCICSETPAMAWLGTVASNGLALLSLEAVHQLSNKQEEMELVLTEWTKHAITL